MRLGAEAQGSSRRGRCVMKPPRRITAECAGERGVGQGRGLRAGTQTHLFSKTRVENAGEGQVVPMPDEGPVTLGAALASSPSPNQASPPN